MVPVMGNLDEEVVDLMRANVVHEVVSPAIVAVHRAEVAADKVPLLVDVPGHVLVLVVQERRDDQPRGEGEDGQEVVQGLGPNSIGKLGLSFCWKCHLIFHFESVAG